MTNLDNHGSRFGITLGGTTAYFRNEQEAQLFIAEQAVVMAEMLNQLRDVVGGPFYADADEKLAAVARILWPELQPENRPPPTADEGHCHCPF
jgi:hypothetical protein